MKAAFWLAGLMAAAPLPPPSIGAEPSPTRAVAAKYPDIATQARVQGTVLVKVRVNDKGVVLEANANDGPLLLRASAEQASRRWAFGASEEPERTVVLTFIFRLVEPDACDQDTMPAFLGPTSIDVPARVVILHSPLGPLKQCQ